MMQLPQHTLLGELTLLEVYLYYDGPQLFSCRNGANHLFLAVCADGDDAAETWLYSPISRSRLIRVRSGDVDLRSAFAEAEDGFVFKVLIPVPSGQAVVEVLPCGSIPPDQLPSADARLAMHSQRLPTNSGADAAAETRNVTARQKTQEYNVVGELIGWSKSSESYELWDAEGEKQYSGKIEPEVLTAQATATVGGVYRATIREMPECSPSTGQVRMTYRLAHLEAVAARTVER